MDTNKCDSSSIDSSNSRSSVRRRPRGLSYQTEHQGVKETTRKMTLKSSSNDSCLDEILDIPITTVTVDSRGIDRASCCASIDDTSTLATTIGDDDEDEAHCVPLTPVPNNNNDDVPSNKHSNKPLRRYYVAYAFGLWMMELLIVVSLKQCGMLDPAFRLDEAVDKASGFSKYVETAVAQLKETIPLAAVHYLAQETKRPGFQLARQGAQAKYPVVMVPGFVTSGLEVWGGQPCAKKHFRQRLWASLGGARSFLMDPYCWRQHMMLDPFTGGDPTGIRMRASQGFEAADFFFAGYWVWNKLIENLADVGYTPSTMSMEAYDWRLSFPMLEKRDGYLTKLKSKIEDMHKTTGKKVVLTSHSMGTLLVHYFFTWVTTAERKGGAGGGRDWVGKHVHAYVNIAGSHLGVPKAATALLSGEMSDTVFIGTMESMVEQFFGRRLRRDLWSTWGALWTMLPKGGDALWGPGADMCHPRLDCDQLCPKATALPLISMTDDTHQGLSEGLMVNNETVAVLNCTLQTFLAQDGHSVEDTIYFIQNYGAGLGPDTAAAKQHSLYGQEKPSSRTWHDPIRTPLPHAPKTQIFCLYGTGIETERAYYYQRNYAHQSMANNKSDNTNVFVFDDPPLVLNSSVVDDNQKVRYGIRYSDGDGTVPLISLGYICVDAWSRKSSNLNPSKSKVYTREYLHQAEFTVDDPLRKGAHSSDHVDILGNVEMTEDLLRVVTGFEVEKIQQNRIASDIERISAEINAHPLGGIRNRRTKSLASKCS
jgi:phospholipid:diacylglycerol acyltransferase